MQAEIVSIPTDREPLDGLFYAAEGPARGAVMLMHGGAMNFYVGAPRFLPPVLTRHGFACLAFNRRGHDILSTRGGRDAEGGAYSTVAEALEDSEIAAAWLKARGFATPIPVGHSHGGVFCARYAADHPEIPAAVLLSAHVGGADHVRRGSARGLFALDEYDALEERARALVAAGKGRELLLLPGWYFVMTAESFMDATVNMPAPLELAPQITCPVLFIAGGQEPPHAYPAEEFCRLAGGPARFEIIPGCDHFYGGHEERIAMLVADFLTEMVA